MTMESSSSRTADFAFKPYWWISGQPSVTPDSGRNLPDRVDVLVVGGGVTGVEAGWTLAQAGRDVVILDAAEPGRGASTRNAGQIGRNFKHSFAELMQKKGLEAAKTYFKELRAAYDSVAQIGASAGTDIGWRKCGRVVAAMTPALFERLKREYALRAAHIGEEVEVVGPADISAELGSELYVGAVRILENGAIQPALYFELLRGRAEQAGARIFAHTGVSHISRERDGFIAYTDRGRLAARDVVIATNGYTTSALPWFKRRLAPIDAFMIATEPLSSDLVKRVLPWLRTYHDNRRTSHYMTFSPDGSRLLFGGRTGSRPTRLNEIASELQDDLRFFFPPLRETRISHAWTGRCAGTRDLFPHVGMHSGMHYAIGYCFSGMAMGPYLARKAAARLLGDKEAAQTVFAADEFPELPLVARGPWLGPILTGYWAWADRPPGLGRRI